MVEVKPGLFTQKYPIGYTLLLAAAYRLAGPVAPFFVNPLLTLLATLGLYFFARLFLNRVLSLIATLTFALLPMISFYGGSALSHTTSLTASVWGLYFAWSWFLRPRPVTAAAAAFLLAFTGVTRSAEILLTLPLLACFLMRCLRPSPAPFPVPRNTLCLHALLAAAAALLALLPLFCFQYTAFGNPFRSGYSLTSESTAFSLHAFLAHAPFYLYAIIHPAFGLHLLFPLALAGLLLLALKRQPAALFLTLAALPITLLYLTYYWSTESDPLLYIRFFLLTFPPLIVAAFLFIDRLARSPRARLIACMLTAFLATLGPATAQDSAPRVTFNSFQGVAVDFVRQNLPPDAVVLPQFLAAYSLIYESDCTVIYPKYFETDWATPRIHTPPGEPPAFNALRTQRYAALFPTLDQPTLDQPALDAALRQTLLDYCRQGRTVAILTVDDFAAPWRRRLAPTFTLTPIAANDDKMILLRLTPIPPQQQ